jgi:hypothetical protein
MVSRMEEEGSLVQKSYLKPVPPLSPPIRGSAVLFLLAIPDELSF